MTESEIRDLAAGWRRSEPYDLVPSGVLRLRIRDEHWTRYELTETKGHVLEDKLNRFIVHLLEAAFEEKRCVRGASLRMDVPLPSTGL